MPYNQINTSTFCNRLFNCSYYKEENNYVKNIKVLFKKIIKQVKSDSESNLNRSIFNILTKFYKPRSFTGVNYIYASDRVELDKLYIKMADNLSTFFKKYKPTKLLDEYLYRGRLKGYIGCTIELRGKTYNLDFSPYNNDMTYYSLYFNKFNSFLYNTMKGTDNDLLVYVIQTDRYYILNNTTYTIGYGLLSTTVARRTYRPGYHCLTCNVKTCKPRLLQSLERL